MNSIRLVFSFRKMQRRLVQTRVYDNLFYYISKEASHKTLNLATAKKSFPSVFIIDVTCFDECFLFHVMTENSIFFTQIYRSPEA